MKSENPYKKYVHLFEGWPDVYPWKVQGEHGMRVAGKHSTPCRLKKANNLSLAAVIAYAVILGLLFRAEFDWIRDHNPEAWAAGAIALFAFLSLFTYAALDVRAAEKPTAVYLSPSFIKIGEKVYDARVQHKFSMDVHRKAKEEADAELRAQQREPKNASIRHKKYYRDAFHIYFEYLGQRILVTDISTEEVAEKLLRALVAVDRIMHKEKTIYAANTNTEEPAETATEARQVDYFGKRPALD